MTESEAIARIQDHFRVHDDGRPTPFLDEAVSMAVSALEEIKWYRKNGSVKRFCDLNERATPKLLIMNRGLYQCRVCGTMYDTNTFRFCHTCGQCFY